MVKIWAKIYRDKKIVHSIMYERPDAFRKESLFEYLTEICETLDIPVPVVLPMHVKHFVEFHNVRFKAAHFVESIDFDMLQLEDVADA